MGRIWATQTIYSANGRMLGAILVDEQTCSVMNVSSDQIKETLKNKTGKIENIVLDSNGVLKEPNLNPRFPDAKGYYKKIKRTYNNSDKVYTMYMYQIIIGTDMNNGTFSVLMGVDGDNCVNRLLNVSFDEYFKSVYGRYTGTETSVKFLNGEITVENFRNGIPNVQLNCYNADAQKYRMLRLAVKAPFACSTYQATQPKSQTQTKVQQKVTATSQLRIDVGNGNSKYLQSFLNSVKLHKGDTLAISRELAYYDTNFNRLRSTGLKIEKDNAGNNVVYIPEKSVLTYKGSTSADNGTPVDIWDFNGIDLRLEHSSVAYGTAPSLTYLYTPKGLKPQTQISKPTSTSVRNSLWKLRLNPDDSKEALYATTTRNCEKLETPKGIKTIQKFGGNINILVLGEDFTVVYDDSFSDLDDLYRVEFGPNVTSIGKNAFTHDYNLESIKLNDNLGAIWASAFYECTQLSGQLLSNVSFIGQKAFTATSLSSLELLGINSIGAGAFADCKKLATVKLHNTLASLGEGAFSGCKSLQKVTFGDNGDSRLEVRDQAFAGCTKLESIKLPRNTKYIGKDVFLGCASLKNISVPRSAEWVDDADKKELQRDGVKIIEY